MDGKPKELTGTRVLIAEDEAAVAMDHADHLIGAGAQIVGPCSRVSQAIRYLETDKVDFAVIDYVLTDGNTEPLQEALEERRVRYVVVTSYPPVLVRRGNEQIQRKPVTSERLLAAIKEAREAQAA